MCHSESIASLRRGTQSALFRLGRVPEFHQIDNSTAATHRGSGGGKRELNDDHLAMTDHFGLKPRTIGVGEKEQNSAVKRLARLSQLAAFHPTTTGRFSPDHNWPLFTRPQLAGFHPTTTGRF